MVGKRLIYTAFIAVLFLFASCQSDEPSNGLSGGGVPTIAAFSQKAVPVQLSDLLTNASVYQSFNIEVAGMYQTMPLHVCAEKPRYAPVTWKLSQEDGRFIYATGLDDSLKRLATPGLALTIQGRWQYWRGPVGCGKGAPVQEFWYVAVDKLISPNPLVLSVSTPDPSLPQPTATELVANLPATATSESQIELPTETPFAEEPTETIVPTETVETSEPTETVAPENTVEASATPLSTATVVVGTATETATVVAGAATSTPSSTATSTPDTVTVTNTPAAGGTNTPMATATTGSGGSFVITAGGVKNGDLAAAQIDVWSFSVAANGTYKITVKPLDGGDMVYTVKKSDGSFEQEVDDFADGWEETADISLTAGEYTITVIEYDEDPALYEISIISQ